MVAGKIGLKDLHAVSQMKPDISKSDYYIRNQINFQRRV